MDTELQVAPLKKKSVKLVLSLPSALFNCLCVQYTIYLLRALRKKVCYSIQLLRAVNVNSSEDNLVTYMKSGYTEKIGYHLGHARQPRSQGGSSLLKRRWELVSDNLGCLRDHLRTAFSYLLLIISFFCRQSCCK